MITVVKNSKGKYGFYFVELSNGETLRVSEDLLVRFRLLKGMEVTPEMIQEIKDNAGYDVGLQQAMNYLSYQLRTEKDVRMHLKDKEIELEDRHKIIRHLKDLKLIDDRMYGESYVRTIMRTSDKGPATIKQQLRQKGLTDDLIEDVLQLYDEKTQYEVAFHTAEKALRKIHHKSFKETTQKVRMALMQKGFNSETISQVLADLPNEQDDEAEYDALVKEGQKILRRQQRKSLRERTQKVKQGLFQKGYQSEIIQRFIDEEMFDEK